MITRPRFDSTTSLSTGGRSSSSSVGILELMRRITQPGLPCCTKVFTRKRPMPGGAIAKLHSFVASNSLVWRSFMMARTRTADCSAVRARSDCGRTSPSILIAGGKPAVMNRSEAFFSTTRRRRSCMSLMPCSLSITATCLFLPRFAAHTDRFASNRIAVGRQPSQSVFVRGFVTSLFFADDALGDEVGEALVERLHARLRAGLDGGGHLRDLAFANQVSNGGRADHDLVRRDAAAAVALEQRLGDDRAQRFGEHRAHHFLFLRREHVDHAVDGLGGRAGV